VVLGLGRWVRGKNFSPYKETACYKMLPRAPDVDAFFGTTWAMENRYEI
jgi:hypothetical protein